MKKTEGLVAAALLLVAACTKTEVPHAAETVDLRGYGTVTANFKPGEATFACASAEKADWLYAKLIRDLANMDARVRPVTNGAVTLSGNRPAIVGRRGNAVVVRDGTDRTGLAFPEPRPYPVFLDNYDLRSHKYYAHPMSSFRSYGVETHWPFAKKHNITGFVFHGLSLETLEAPGVVDYSSIDYEMEAARRAGGAVGLSLGVGSAWPLWLYNEGPEHTAKMQTATTVEEWTPGTPTATFAGYGRGFDPKKSPVRAFQKEVMARYKDHPNLAYWQLYCGAPIGDQFGPAFDGFLWDASDAAKAAFRDWAKTKWTLAELGARWHGDATHFKTWDDVVYPQLMDLVGGDYDTGRLCLSGLAWEWLQTPKGAYGTYPADAGAKWVKFHFPPSQRLQFLQVGSAYFRLKNLPGDWLAGKTGQTLYLKAVCSGYDDGILQAWVNGKLFKSEPLYTASTKMTHLVLPPNTLKGDGTDEIVFQTPDGKSRGGGRIHGPISLSLSPAENFPYRDKRVNARYVDARAFEYAALKRRNEDMFRFARHIDPDRPLAISGAEWGLFAELLPFFGEQGVSIQTTSIDAFYWPQIVDWGMLYGYYGVAEPSGNLREGNYANVYGQQLYNGMSASAMFMEIEMYMDLEKKTGLVSKWASLLRLFGHYLVEQPKFAQMCSIETHAYSTASPQFDWNLLRGELQCAHYDGLLVTDMELKNGKVTADTIPVVMDMSDIMTEETVAAIRAYVAAGGTFIATPRSGRHTIFERNVHPLAALSGVRVEDEKRGGKLTFSKTQTLFPEWAGQTIDGDGDAKDWKMRPCSDGAKISVLAKDVEVVAAWGDGTPAITVRNLGRGRIVTLATGFYRNARDVRGKWFPLRANTELAQMMRQLGLKRTVNATQHKVWVRKAISKTGTEDFVIAANMSETEPHDVVTDIEIPLAYTPQQVIDGATGRDVAFTFTNGVCRLPGLAFSRYDTKIFAIPRPEGAAEALKVWWREKTKYWRRGPRIVEVEPEPTPATAVSIDTWQFRVDGEKTWREAKAGTWKIQFEDLKNYRGGATYRREFTLPADWKGRRVTLNFEIMNAIHDQADFFVNGVRVASVDRTRQHREIHGLSTYEISAHLRFDKPNVLDVRMTGGSTLIAGISGNVFFAVERDFAEEIQLAGDWELVKANYVDTGKATVPGTFTGRCIRRTFTAPKSWAGKRIFARIDSPEISISALVLNDRGKGKLQNYGQFGNRTEINVTEFVKPGETNTIELWPRRTIPTPYYGVVWNWPKEDKISVENVIIGPVK